MPKFPSLVKSKLPNTGTTIFATMSALANEHKAINLSQGFPEFDANPKLVELVKQYVGSNHNQYAPMQGIQELRDCIAEKVEKLYKAKFNPETEINVTAGATQALYTAITALIKEGDEVIVFTPAYDSYTPAIELNGGITISVQLEAPHYKINWSDVKKVLSQRTRMIILNTPHNPTGSVMTAKDMKELERITKDSDIILLSDEVYEHILFDGQAHESVLKYPKLAERSVAVFSFGKTYHATGWKVGYALAPANLMKEFRKVHQFQVFTVNRPMQHALADFMQDPDEYLHLNELYQKKRDLFLEAIKGSRFKAIPAKGTYFQLLQYDKITDQRDVDYAVELTKKNGVASIPVSVFYNKEVDNKVLRFCFAKEEDTLKKAGELLCKI